MRTLPSAAPATAAQPAHLTPTQRKTVILGRIEKLQARAPEGLSTWDYQKIKAFTSDVAKLSRLQRGPMSHILRISERVAKEYGVTMDRIDPCHGEAA